MSKGCLGSGTSLIEAALLDGRATDTWSHLSENRYNEHQRHNPAHFAEVSGAVTMLKQLAEKRDWLIAVATGCWRASAEMKLRAANIALHEKPAGFAEDGPSREAIVSAAIARAQQTYNRTSFDKIVSVGDGVWDVKTAANLGLAFVGIGAESRAESLRQNGARHVTPHYEDNNTFFMNLEEAMIPVIPMLPQ